MKFLNRSLLALLFAAFFVFLPADVEAKDTWLQVRSKNFFLIGNASEKDIRKVATKLEQFRESFRQIFGGGGLTASIPTNVVVFKSDSSYKPFKPKRGDGKIDNFIVGYFQPGEDVNYITLSTEGVEDETYDTIFHEYVHFMLNTSFGETEVPPWFNEGLAEYYSTFKIEEDQKVHLGRLKDRHVLKLRENQMIPLGSFFELSNAGLHAQGDHSRTIFYSQAWAIIHYLTFKQKTAGLRKFLSLRMANKPAEAAFTEAFGMTYPQMEKELRQYVAQGSFNYMILPLKEKLTFDADMQTSPLTEADSNAYLGDLLYHIRRFDDAEPFLNTALGLKPDLSMANTTLGMVKLRQRKFDEAKSHLEKAIAQDQKNHLALYNYAYLLSREGRDEFGLTVGFEAETAAKMRDALKKSIALNPNFTESYELLAFVNLVNNDDLDETIALMKKAMTLQPGNTRYMMRVAELYLRQGNFKEASAIAEKIAKGADDEGLRSRAEQIASEIRQREEMAKAREKYASMEGSGASTNQVMLRRKPGEEAPTPEQLAKAQELARMRGLNQSLRTLGAGEKQIVGRITKIECRRNDVVYSINAGTESLLLSTKDFQTLTIVTYVPDSGAEVGCNSNLSRSLTVIAYRPSPAAKPPVKGELVSIEFVPEDFRLMDLTAEEKETTYVVEETGPNVGRGEDADMRRSVMLTAIRQNLRKPAAGERQELGFIERSECSNKGIFVFMKVGTNILKLSNATPQTLFMRAYTPDVADLQLGCGMKQVDVPVVFVYRENADPKAKSAGDLVSMEFVPKTFTLR